MRALLYRHIESSAWEGQGLSPFNRIVCALILLAVAVAVLESEPLLVDAYGPVFHALEGVFLVLFSAEYGLRVYVAGENPRYKGLRGRLRYMVSFWAIIDLMAILPAVVTLGTANSFLLRLFRIVRLLRVARMGPYSVAIDALGRAFHRRRHEIFLSMGVALMMLLFSGTLLYAVEGGVQPEAFGSIPRALWWSVATLTTVGYGDVTPITMPGKVLAGFTAIAGIGLVALPAGILAAAFSDAFQETDKKKEESDQED